MHLFGAFPFSGFALCFEFRASNFEFPAAGFVLRISNFEFPVAAFVPHPVNPFAQNA